MIVHLVDGRVKGFASRGCRGTHTGMFYVYLLHSTKDNGFYIGYSKRPAVGGAYAGRFVRHEIARSMEAYLL